MVAQYFKTSLVFFAGVVVFFLCLEAVLRVLPVNTGLRMQATDNDHAFMRAYPHQEYSYSYGWAFANARRGQTNSLGLPNSKEWITGKPTVLVVGDSYIESLMNNYDGTLQGDLEKSLENMQIVAMANSGANAADYLQMMKFAGQQLNLRSLVFRIDGSDFLESLVDAANQDPGHARFENEDGNVHIHFRHYAPSKLKEFLRNSAVACYLQRNLKFEPVNGIKRELSKSGKSLAEGRNETMKTDSTHEIEAVIDFFLQQLPLQSGIPLSDTVFVTDCNRKNLYAKWLLPAAINDDADGVLEYFVRNAKAKGAIVIDTCPAMEAYVRQTRQRLDFSPLDLHWSPVGHALVANAVIPELKRILPR